MCMYYLIAVFTSRNETIYFANMLIKSGIQTSIVNTPKEAGQVCGISVKISENMKNYAKNLLNSRPFRSFYGFFRISEVGSNRKIIERI